MTALAEPAAGSTWRTILSTSDPKRVALVVVAVAAATYGYVALLIVGFDARSWWGSSLPGMAAAFGAMACVSGVLLLPVARRRGHGVRRLAGFLTAGWFGLTLVSWLPRQRPGGWPELAQLAWWTGWAIAIYVLVPVTYAFVMRQSIRDYGLRLGLFRGELGVFAVLLPVILVGAFLAAGQPRFQETYPYYSGWPGTDALPASGGPGHLLGWWLMYAGSFVALEFFFRGFLVAAAWPIVGWWAVPAMAAPYCLLHLDKPLPEMLSSLVGGMLLGAVAARTGSILAGVLAHVTLAIGTDAGVLLRRG